MGALVGDPRLPTTPTPRVVDEGGELGPESGVLLQSVWGGEKRVRYGKQIKLILARFLSIFFSPSFFFIEGAAAGGSAQQVGRSDSAARRDDQR